MKKYIYYLLALLAPLTGSGCEKTATDGDFLELEKDKVVFASSPREQKIVVKSAGAWSFRKKNPADAWFTLSKSEGKLSIAVVENIDSELRQAEIVVSSGEISKPLIIQQAGGAPSILIEKTDFVVKNGDASITLLVVSNVEYDMQLAEGGEEWITILPASDTKVLSEKEVELRVAKNEYFQSRTTTLTFRALDGSTDTPVHITQEAGVLGTDDIELGNPKIQIVGGSTSSVEPSEPFEYSYDGDKSTRYHSMWNPKPLANGESVEMIYWFAQPEQVDYLCYYPRDENENGMIGQFDLYYKKSRSESQYTFIGAYDFEQKGTSMLVFDEPVAEAVEFKLVVKSGRGNDVSCGEMEFYKGGEGIVPAVFADEVCSELKTGVTMAQINEITEPLFRNIARALYEQSYPAWPVQKYTPYKPLSSLQAEIKTSTYNRYENPTGIYFTQGENIVVFTEKSKAVISLRIKDFNDQGQEHVFALAPGGNKINVPSNGLGYIDYYTDAYKTTPDIKVHIIGGKHNGTFVRGRDAASDWNLVLNNAKSDFIDIVGNYVHLVYRVEDLIQACPDGMALIEVYDRIIYKQFDVMGLVKFNRVPKNHMFARWVKSGLFADGLGAGFGMTGMSTDLLNAEHASKRGVWVIAHEFGHVNQVRPALKWHGTAETTNNVYAINNQWEMDPNGLNLERYEHNDGDGNFVIGGRFNAYLNNGVMRGEPWPCQKGPDKMTNYQNGGDHFVRLCPFWQLFLYFVHIPEAEWYTPDWYKNINEKARARNLLQEGYKDQLQFMRDVCDETQCDLSEFFAKAGLLKPIDIELDDYGVKRHVITQADCEALVAYASKYKKPATPVLNYISANSIGAFTRKAAVEGRYNQGLESGGDHFVISHSEWKNVVVFETYKGDKMERIAMVGTDARDPQRSTTRVRYPTGSTRIEAVGWDGTRTLVYGAR